MIVIERFHVGLDPIFGSLLCEWLPGEVVILKKFLDQHGSGLRACAWAQGFRMELNTTDLNKQEYSREKSEAIPLHLMNIAPDHENASSFQILLFWLWGNSAQNSV